MTVGVSVDVVIDNYNYGEFLAGAIESALSQTVVPDRIIVVDDGSTDDSREVIASYGDRLVTVLKQNGGQASALNVGFSRTTADLIIFLDADDMLLSATCERIVEAAGRNRSLAKVQYPMLVVDAAGKCTGATKPPPHLPLPSGELWREELCRPFDMTWMSTSGNAFPRWVLERLLPIPEIDFFHCADWYLCHLSPLLGPVVSLEEAGALYRIHGRNSYQPVSSALDLVQIRKSVVYAATTQRHIDLVAGELGLARDRPSMSVADLANRLISKRFEPEGHPIPTDTVTSLVSDGCKAALRRFDVGFPVRWAFCAWFVLMGVAPRMIASVLAERFLFPERRQAVNGLLLRLRRDQAV